MRKGTQISWEKDASSPPVSALEAWSVAGADALYIVTGMRREDRRADVALDIKEQLAAIRRDLLNPAHDDTLDSKEGITARYLDRYVNSLGMMLRADASLLSDEQAAEAAQLMELATDPERLRARRIEEHNAQRARREQARRRLAAWFDNESYKPSASIMNMLLTISHEYEVPARMLSDLVEEIHSDLAGSTKPA